MNLQWPLFQAALKLIFRHPIFGVTIIPVQEDGRIVLVRRRDTNRWSLPGGIVEWGEDIRSTIHRELAEETGLQLKAMGRLVGVYSAPKRDPRFHSICTTVEVMVYGNFAIQDHYEVAEVRAFQRDEIVLGELSHDHQVHLNHYWDGATVLS